MNRDTLFLLPPGFSDNQRREYCPECAEVWGLLHYYPAIKDTLSIVYVGINRPRRHITELLGDHHQNAPTLILHPDNPRIEGCGIQTVKGHNFIDNARDIGRYYAEVYGTAWPRGH